MGGLPITYSPLLKSAGGILLRTLVEGGTPTSCESLAETKWHSYTGKVWIFV